MLKYFPYQESMNLVEWALVYKYEDFNWILTLHTVCDFAKLLFFLKHVED